MRSRISIAILVLMVSLCASIALSQSLRDGISEGQTKRIGADELTLVVVSDRSGRAVFAWNGEMSTSLEENEQHTFQDGTRLSITDVIDDEAGDGNDYVEFFLLPSDQTSSSTDDPEYDLCPLFDPDSCPETEEERAIRETREAEESAALDTSTLDTAVGNECKKSSDCVDTNPCTKESCMVGLCQIAKPTGCADGSVCLPYGVQLYKSNISFYCDTTSNLLETRNERATCKLNYQCTSNSCANDQCQPGTGAVPGILQPAESSSSSGTSTVSESSSAISERTPGPLTEEPRPVQPRGVWQSITAFFRRIWDSLFG